MELRQWLNRLTLMISVPTAIYMVGRPNIPTVIESKTAGNSDSPQYHLIKPELQNLSFGETNLHMAAKTSATQGDGLLAKAKEFTSIQDFMNLKLDQETKDLLSQMQADQFQSGNPYHNLSNVYPVAILLSKGVVRWNRHVFRSGDFNQEYGYDVVKYEVTHQDTSTSYILAYRDKSLDQRLWLGEEDQRPTLATFLINRGDGRVFRMHFQNGEIIQSDNEDLSIALSNVQERVEKATPVASRDSF